MKRPAEATPGAAAVRPAEATPGAAAMRPAEATPGAAARRRAGEALSQLGRRVAQTLRLMIGLPDYDAYVEHTRRAHPDRPVMSYEAFFRDRQEARYGGKGRVGHCC